MRTDVALKKPRPREALAAVLALAALIVRPHVHGKRRHADVQFVAMGTSSRLLIGRTAVRLSMAGQIARRAVLLAALGTLVLAALVRLRLRAAGRLWRRAVRKRF